MTRFNRHDSKTPDPECSASAKPSIDPQSERYRSPEASWTRDVICSICGSPAMITLTENVDLLRGSGGHEITCRCDGDDPSMSEVELLQLWAAGRTSA